MSLDVTGFITWIRTFLDDVYAEKGSSGTDLELNLIPKSQNPNGVVCISGGNVNYDLDKVYPVGSIYMSVNPTNPSTLFGGTWVQLTNTFLYASSTAITQSNTTATDGEATHTLITDEMPSHTHTQASHSHMNPDSAREFVTHVKGSGIGEKRVSVPSSGSTYAPTIESNDNWWGNTSTGGATATNNNAGGGQAHNNMPPYMQVNMWKRTA